MDQEPLLTLALQELPTLLSLASIYKEETQSLDLTGLLGGWNGRVTVEEANPLDPMKQIWASPPVCPVL